MYKRGDIITILTHGDPNFEKIGGFMMKIKMKKKREEKIKRNQEKIYFPKLSKLK